MAVVVEAEDLKLARQRTGALLLAGVAAVVFSLAVLLYVLWLIVAAVKATPFDADGVRCYTKADQTVCLKTAEPSR